MIDVLLGEELDDFLAGRDEGRNVRVFAGEGFFLATTDQGLDDLRQNLGEDFIDILSLAYSQPLGTVQ